MCLWVFSMHFIGLAGLPRRYYTNTNFPLFDDLQNVNVLITTFALIGAFQLIFLYIFSVVYSTERNLFKIHGILIPSNGLPCRAYPR
jgi:heme/copper-type cytochrome/quinol oxidase subunit 1